MSRPMTADEDAAFEAKYGYKVSSFRVAVDALAVYVNKENPIPCLTLPQLSGIFSSNRKAPGSADIKTWSDLGVAGEWSAATYYALQPQYAFGDVRVFPRGGALRRRLQAWNQGAGRFGSGGASGGGGQVRHRLLRHRL